MVPDTFFFTPGPGCRRGGLSYLPRVFGNLKTWLRGTHHGVETTPLHAYLDEFTFRFNRRRTPMAAFQSLFGLTGAHEPTTYTMLDGLELTG
jgi:hypothetical protein